MAVKAAGFRERTRLTEEEAEALTAEIVEKLSAAYRDIAPLMLRAYRGHAWAAVGFSSWDEYCRSYFQGPRMLRFSDEQLTELCAELAGEGMSVRAIGSGLGIGHATAARKVLKKGNPPATVTGLDERRQRRDKTRADSMAAHPAGKASPVDVAGMRPAEIVLMHISLSAAEGLTYTQLCEVTGWRDSPVTGALAGLARREAIVTAGERDGHKVWTAQ